MILPEHKTAVSQTQRPTGALAALDAVQHQPYFALLYSGQQLDYSGNISLLAYDLKESVSGNSFAPLAPKLTQHLPRFENSWFGYLGYGLKDSLEALTPEPPGWLELPPLWMGCFAHVQTFEHQPETLMEHDIPPAPAVLGGSLESNMSRDTYLYAVRNIIERIHAGDLYQANLTRKFRGRFAQPFAVGDLFRRLVWATPSAFSAYLRVGDAHILSSSPESFLHIDPDLRATARPIKGSSARGNTPEEDTMLREALRNSTKDRAENLMIVDLQRNDLARACVAGSVEVEALCEIATYPTIHHMFSTISGQIASGRTALDAVRACFPPASMTGAPKIAAMELCTRLEQMARGVYSGALGWFGGDGSADLSVVIRTLIIQGDRFEFQVGGGIVADSTPEGEWRETLTKAKGICKALSIAPEILAEL